MLLDLLRVQESYFPKLANDGVVDVLDLRWEHDCEKEQDLRRALSPILVGAETSDDAWLFSFAGTMAENKNLALLEFLTARRFQTAYAVFEFCKPNFDIPLPLVEISFTCPLELLTEFLEKPALDWWWDFKLGGWLVPKSEIKSMLMERKFRGPIHYPARVAKLGFCSSDDWDAIQFFSSDQNILRDIQNRYNHV